MSYTDPFVPTLAARAWHGGRDLTSVPLDDATLASVDCVAILTDHTSIDYEALAARGVAGRRLAQRDQAEASARVPARARRRTVACSRRCSRRAEEAA